MNNDLNFARPDLKVVIDLTKLQELDQKELDRELELLIIKIQNGTVQGKRVSRIVTLK